MNDKKVRDRILIVDDMPANIKVLGHAIAQDYDIKVVISGADALRVAMSDWQPDLILLDIVMPELDGYGVCRKLKADEKTRDIPVIFVTGLVEVENETLGFELGAVDYITKPISPSRVRARIKTHLALRRAQIELKKQNAILEENSRLRDDVERITRHDLKAPLSAIIGLPQILQLDDNLTDEQLKYLEMLQTAGYKMLGMINRSLDLYKMEVGKYKFQPQPVNLNKVFSQVLSELKILAVNKSLSIDIWVNGKPATEKDIFLIPGEEMLCYSLFANLLKNAIEASPADEIIRVSLENKQNAVISVQNKGAIPLEIRETFFDKYVSHGKNYGTGLGTYSAQLITKTMGGKIDFKITENDETILVVEFPAL